MKADFFVLRTPLLPYTTLLEWTRDLSSPRAADDQLEQAVEQDSSVLRARLRTLLDGDPVIEEAIHVASPDLAEGLAAWREDPLSERGRRAERSLIRYVARMSSRPTPYGLFAGFGIGAVGGRTQICVAPREQLRRHVRLDMEYVSAVVSRLDANPALRPRLRYRVNSSLYEAAGGLRYVEHELDAGSRRHRLVAAESSDYLRAVLVAAVEPRSLDDLAELLVGDEITRPDALAFLHELVDAQLLVSDLEPATTGPEPVPPLIGALEALGPDGDSADTLGALRAAQCRIESLRAEPLGVPPGRYEEIAAVLEPAGVPIQRGRLLQVDLVRPGDGSTLGSDVVAQVLKAIKVLHRLAPARTENALTAFARAFEARYEGREVPLVEVLDEESGIGFDRSSSPAAEASPLIAGVPLPGAPAHAVQWEPVHSLLLAKVHEAQQKGEREIRLDERELEDAGIQAALPLPASLAVMGVVLGPGRVELTGAVGPSGARLLGRFCHADADLAAKVRELLRAEEAADPERVYAEIVHLPEGRVGNVTMRPPLRRYEIPYLGRSGLDPERQLPLEDLSVSVRGGRVILRSRRLGREVVPRLSSAHNFALGISPYRFLCALQNQGCAAVGGFSWGPLESAPFLPRVVTGSVVLEAARWRLGREEVAELQKGGFRGWRRLRERLGLPRHLQLREGDNHLALDLDNPLLLDAALPLLTRARAGVLVEILADPEALAARGPDGGYAHEFVLPLTTASPVTAPAARTTGSGGVRDFMPGSEWLYARIDCGTAAADRVLQVVAEEARAALRDGAACDWFFVRYADPDWHLRLRLRGDPARLVAEVLPRLHAALRPLEEQRLVSGLRLDTYRREVERYGGPAAIEAVERIFCVDSDRVAAMLALLQGDEGLDARWRLGLLGSDLLLRDLGLEGDRKLRTVRLMRDTLRQEFKTAPATLRAIAHKFGAERAALIQLLRGGAARDELDAGVACLESRTPLWAEAMERLHALDEDGCLDGGLEQVATSLVHMHLNRVLRSAHRANELVLYDLWERCLLVPEHAGRREAAAIR